jgi:uncharacterized membrane protein
MPPLLTIVLFIWAWSVIERYILVPSENAVGSVIAFADGNTLTAIPPGATKIVESKEGTESFDFEDRNYEKSGDAEWVGYYPLEHIKENQLQRGRVLPFFIALFLLVLYLLGKFVAAGVGRMIVGWFDALIQRLPLVSNVYSAVKQVTDFIFSEREIEFNRVVAIEYPRKGMWSIGFVTGESMLDIRSAANESVLSVLMPTSPMPMTGFTVTVLKSEAIDLNLTVDQAIQFVISCGVVVPAQQQVSVLNGTSEITEESGTDGDNGRHDAGGQPHRPGKIEDISE